MNEDKLLSIISGQLTTLILLVLGLFISMLFRPTTPLPSSAKTLPKGVSTATESIMSSDAQTEIKQLRESDIKVLDSSAECTVDRGIAENAAIISSTRQFKEFLENNYIYDYNASLLSCKSTGTTSTMYTFIVANTDIAFDVTVDTLGGCTYSSIYNILNTSYPPVLFIYDKPSNAEDLYKAMEKNNITGICTTDYHDGSSSCSVINAKTGKIIKHINI